MEVPPICGRVPPVAALALVATATTSYVSPHETIAALNDGSTPAHSDDKRRGAYGNWPRSGTQWVEYAWSRPVAIDRVEVYWFDDGRGVRLPKACRLVYWDGRAFLEVPGARGLGLEANRFNATTSPEIETTRLRLEIDSDGTFSTGILEWRVYDSGRSPNFPPSVEAGVDRTVCLSGRTYLEGTARDDGKPRPALELLWRKASGPGEVAFEDPRAASTAATFSAAGEYAIELVAHDGELSSTDSLRVIVDPPPPPGRLDPVPTGFYRLGPGFWRDRLKKVIVD